MNFDKNKIKCIIFDVDGTMIDTDQLVIASYEETFRIFRPDYILTEEEKISFLGPTLKVMFAKYFKEDFEVVANVFRTYQVAHTKEFAKCFDYVIETLEMLKAKGYILAVCTSRLRESALYLLNAVGLVDYFDMIITLDEVVNAKPDPEGLLLIKDFYHLNDDEVLYVGDNKSDYLAGVNAKTKTALISWARGRDNSLLNPDLLIYSYKDLIEIFGE